jgi:hypothetical protein
MTDKPRRGRPPKYGQESLEVQLERIGYSMGAYRNRRKQGMTHEQAIADLLGADVPSAP